MLDLQSRVLQHAAVFSELSRAAAEIDWFDGCPEPAIVLSLFSFSILSFATIAKVKRVIVCEYHLHSLGATASSPNILNWKSIGDCKWAV